MPHDEDKFDVEIVHTVRKRGAPDTGVPYSRTTQEYGDMGEAAMNFTEKVFISDTAAVMVAAGMAKAAKK